MNTSLVPDQKSSQKIDHHISNKESILFSRDPGAPLKVGSSGQLGLGTDENELLPAWVGGADEVFDGEAVVMVVAGDAHAAGVTRDGALWSWGDGQWGQLGQGDEEPRQQPQRLCREMYGGLPAVMVACGFLHTLLLTAGGCVWSCGLGRFGPLGHNAEANELRLRLVDHFKGDQIVMVAAGGHHSVALGAEGTVWTWGWGRFGVYTYIYIHICVSMHVYIHEYIHTYKHAHTCTHICIHTCIYVYICI